MRPFTRNRSVLWTVAGLALAGFGLVLPPAAVVNRFLPPEGALYREQLVAGFWWFKLALVLNGIALGGHRWIRLAWGKPPEQADAERGLRLDRRDVALAAFVSVVALWARAIRLDQSLIADEIAIQQMFIARGLPVIMTYMPPMPQHVLYSVLAYCCEFLPLPLEVSYRLPAVLFGAASPALAYVLARRLLPRPDSFIVGLLCALSMYGVLYSQMAKSYSMTECAFLVAVLAALRITDGSMRTWPWLTLGAAIFVLVFGHLYNVFMSLGLVVALASVLAVAFRRQPATMWLAGRRLATVLTLCGIALLLVYALQLPQLIALSREVQTQPEERMSARFFEGWLLQMTFWGRAEPLSYVFLLLVATGAVRLCIRGPGIMVLLATPPAVVLLNAAVNGSFIYARYLVFVLPLLMLCYVGNAQCLGMLSGSPAARRVALVVLFGLYMAPTGPGLAEYYRMGHQNLRGACEYAEQVSERNDRILAYGLCFDELPFYGDRVEGVPGLQALRERTASAAADVYLLVAYPGVLAHRPEDVAFIKSRYRLVKRFEGMLMDSNRRDGDVLVYKAPGKNKR